MKRHAVLLASLAALGCPSEGAEAPTADGSSTTATDSTTGRDSTATTEVATTEIATTEASTTEASTSTSTGSVGSSGSTTDDNECDREQLLCDEECVDPLVDLEYCGASGDCQGDDSGTTCERGQACVDGECVSTQGWGTEEIIDAGVASVHPRIAMNAQGQALVVYEEQGEPVSNGMATHFDPAASGWTDAAVFEQVPWNVSRPDVALDPAGNAFTVWTSVTETLNTPQVSRWDTAMQAWGVAQELGGNPIEFDIQVATDAAGNAMVVYRRQGGGGAPAYAHRYEVGGSWTLATNLDDDFVGDLPQLAMDPDGNVMAVWQRVAFSPVLAARRYDVMSATWGDLELIDPSVSALPRTARAAADTQGNVFVVWQPFGDQFIFAKRWDAGSQSWGPTQTINDDSWFSAGFPDVAADASGNAIAVWHQRATSDEDPAHVFASRWDAGMGSWSVFEQIDDAERPTETPDVAMDSNGDALVVWIAHDPATNGLDVGGTRYDVESGMWEPPVAVEDTPGDVYVGPVELDAGPQVAIDDRGRGLAVWTQDIEGVVRVLANRYE